MERRDDGFQQIVVLKFGMQAMGLSNGATAGQVERQWRLAGRSLEDEGFIAAAKRPQTRVSGNVEAVVVVDAGTVLSMVESSEGESLGERSARQRPTSRD